jgi:chaperonin cofactor prefoldin
MIKYVKEKELSLIILTNFISINHTLIKKLVKHKIRQLAINLPAATAEVYVHMCPIQTEETFNKIIKNLHLLNKIKNKYENLPEIKLIFIICNENYKEILKYIKLGKKLGVSYIEFKIAEITEQTKKIKLTRKQFDELKKIIYKAKNLATKSKMKTNLFELERMLTQCRNVNQFTKEIYRNIGCYIGWINLDIEMDRTVSPCCICIDTKIKKRNLADIWKSKEFEVFRKNGIDKKWRRSHKLCEMGCFNCPWYNTQIDIYNELKKYTYFR